MRVGRGQAEVRGRRAFEIHFDEHGLFVPDDRARVAGSRKTTAGATHSFLHPSGKWASRWPRARNPTWACMQSSEFTAFFMWFSHVKPGL